MSLFGVRAFSTAETTQEESSIRTNRLHSGIALNPHPAKRHKGGEDAATVTETFIAVADGVGGWAESGIDPAKYSRTLCKNIEALLLYDGGQRYMCNPTQLLVEAVEQTRETGSSTCVITSLDREAPLLYTANLGDSGYLLLRKSGLDLVSVFRSKEQTHSFNFPFQIGTGGDDPAGAEQQTHAVAHNDILVVGSDGLFDNLFDVKIIELIRPFVRGRDDLLDPGLVAEIISKEAEKFSNNAGYMSPFAKTAKAHFYDYVGGKPDDITVAVAQVKIASKETDKKTIETPVDV